ncbi:hypothetical protein CsSME_00010121 [Camellia sinensis var. sinensis]
MFELLLCAYSTVNIQDTALLLGMNDDDATNYKFLTTQSLAYDDINTFLNQNNIRGKIVLIVRAYPLFWRCNSAVILLFL